MPLSRAWSSPFRAYSVARVAGRRSQGEGLLLPSDRLSSSQSMGRPRADLTEAASDEVSEELVPRPPVSEAATRIPRTSRWPSPLTPVATRTTAFTTCPRRGTSTGLGTPPTPPTPHTTSTTPTPPLLTTSATADPDPRDSSQARPHAPACFVARSRLPMAPHEGASRRSMTKRYPSWHARSGSPGPTPAPGHRTVAGWAVERAGCAPAPTCGVIPDSGRRLLPDQAPPGLASDEGQGWRQEITPPCVAGPSVVVTNHHGRQIEDRGGSRGPEPPNCVFRHLTHACERRSGRQLRRKRELNNHHTPVPPAATPPPTSMATTYSTEGGRYCPVLSSTWR